MSLITYDTRDEQARALAIAVSEGLVKALAHKPRAVLSVPGGTTPGPFFAVLAALPLEWHRVTVVLNDERWVLATHERSNERLLRETLLTGPAAAARYVPLYADTPEPEAGLDTVEAAVRAALPIDVLVLGMGADMHTASLFPGADRLAEALDPEGTALVLPLRAPGAPEARITLTLPALLSAQETHILITGAEKRAALDAATTDGPEAEAPVRAILRRANPTIHHAP